MSSLDDKLRGIFVNDFAFHLNDNTIAQIKQTFADERYCWQGFRPNSHLMSGQEWYDRFLEELTNMGFAKTHKEAAVYMICDTAVKRAAGLSNE